MLDLLSSIDWGRWALVVLFGIACFGIGWLVAWHPELNRLEKSFRDEIEREHSHEIVKLKERMAVVEALQKMHPNTEVVAEKATTYG